MMMMMLMNGETARSNPTIQVPPWDNFDDPTATITSPLFSSPNATSPNCSSSPFDALTALHRYLPSNNSDFDNDCHEFTADAFSCDHFRMYDFKVRKCARGRSHDWTECPFAHPGEKARRRDPRKHHYSGVPCPDFRKGHCFRGDACEYAHGVFECWLHPARYRTQPCKDGAHCRRRVCFFAHAPDQLRVLPQTSPRLSDSYDGSPSRLGFDACFGSSPTSILYSPTGSPPSDSPPMSPIDGVNSVSELAASIRCMQIGGKVRVGMMSPPAGWGMQVGSGYCSPRGGSVLRPGFLSLPSTPTRAPTRSGLGVFDLCEEEEEEPVMERVESGRDLRAKIYAKLSKENSLGRVDSAGNSVAACPDVGWVSELLK
ncbi:zinc finger CCCH domain-containing protein 23-like [Rhododendron vialii]|uniref:zinc finger CCCH domain-containing protein 23-like n=1 Tax=Rhododendron vialii TaxID=182163 RepID=UPI00265E36A4|nr:zinc finger CCCH domain-containing protein 23-like [Rhododendron vialii]